MGIFKGIIEPEPNEFEAEYRYRFDAKSPAGPHVVVQGNVNTEELMIGNEFEGVDNEYEEDRKESKQEPKAGYEEP